MCILLRFKHTWDGSILYAKYVFASLCDGLSFGVVFFPALLRFDQLQGLKSLQERKRGVFMKKTRKSSSSTSTGKATSASPKHTSTGGNDAARSSTVPQHDGGVASDDDLYVYTATDMIHQIVAAYCNMYDTSYMTKYLLSLLLEALVPGAPSFAKEQAHNQLELMSGSAGLRETVELVKFVQAAGRVTNEVIVENGRREMERITVERRVRFAADDEVARVASAESEDGADVDNAAPQDDIAYITSARGSLDLRIVPAASIHTELQKKCAAQETLLADREQRIRELEATLAEHRPVFELVQQKASLDEKPEMILKKGLKKGTVVKKGKSVVSFIDGEEDAAQAAQGQQQPRVVRFDSTRDEVIAAARALAMEARHNITKGRTPPPPQQQQPEETGDSPAAFGAGLRGPPPPPPPPQRQPYASTPYMHHLAHAHPTDSFGETNTNGAASVGIHRNQRLDPYSLLADVPLHNASSPAQHYHRHMPPSTPPPPNKAYEHAWTVPSSGIDVLPLSSHLLSAEDVVRIVSDKRPLAAQAAQSFSAWYQLEQTQRAQLLLDLGESSLLSSIQHNAQLSSRLAGASHSLALERRYSSNNRAPSSLEYIGFAHSTSSPLSRHAAEQANNSARRHVLQQHAADANKQFVPQASRSTAVGDASYGGLSSYVNTAARLPSRSQLLNADGSSLRRADHGDGTVLWM